MSRAKIVRDSDGKFYGIRFDCPGCLYSDGKSQPTILPVHWLPPHETEESPVVNSKPHWTFNGDFNRPTFGPSVLSRWDMPADGEYPAEHHCCHSFVRHGRIEFLADCTHALAGQTVDLPEIEGEDA